MKFVVPAAVVGAAALVAAGCALPAAAASASHSHHAPAVAAVALASHPLVHEPVTSHPTHVVKPAPAPGKHKPSKTKPAPKKSHVKKPHPLPVVKPVITTTAVTVHGVAGQVTLTKLKGVSSLALSVAGQTWNGIDLGQDRNQAVYSWVKGRSFDTVHSLTQQLDAQFPGASDALPADLQLASLAF